MNIMIVTNSNYVVPTITMLYSLFENNQEVIDVFMLYSDMSSSDIAMIQRMAENWKDKHIIPLYITDEMTKNLKPTDVLPIETYYRIIGMKLLEDKIDKILYLDTDMVIKKSIVDMYDMDISNVAFAVCKDIYGYIYEVANDNCKRVGIPDGRIYWNAGVMLINLQYTKKVHATDNTLTYIYHNIDKLLYMDQDALNHMFYDYVKLLDWRIYNCTPVRYICKKSEVQNGIINPLTRDAIASHDFETEECYDMTQAVYEDAKIIHYIGETKPWNEHRPMAETFNIFDSAFLNYRELAKNLFH